MQKCRDGEMFLIVGPSGSGKTSLLRILAGRHAHGDWQGQLVADGAVRIVWTPKDDGLDGRLEHRAMSLLAVRIAADPSLAAAWRDLATPAHGELQELAA